VGRVFFFFQCCGMVAAIPPPCLSFLRLACLATFALPFFCFLKGRERRV